MSAGRWEHHRGSQVQGVPGPPPATHTTRASIFSATLSHGAHSWAAAAAEGATAHELAQRALTGCAPRRCPARPAYCPRYGYLRGSSRQCD